MTAMMPVSESLGVSLPLAVTESFRGIGLPLRCGYSASVAAPLSLDAIICRSLSASAPGAPAYRLSSTRAFDG